MGPAVRAQMGIAEGLIRLSVGIEDEADLLADFAQAFDNTQK
jgi:O-acetylhomoserine (thiol)-lyase